MQLYNSYISAYTPVSTELTHTANYPHRRLCSLASYMASCPYQVKSPLSKMLQKSKFAPLSSVTLQPDVGAHTVCVRASLPKRRSRREFTTSHEIVRPIPNHMIGHVTIGFLYLHCTHTRYIFNCFPLFTCSLRST